MLYVLYLLILFINYLLSLKCKFYANSDFYFFNATNTVPRKIPSHSELINICWVYEWIDGWYLIETEIANMATNHIFWQITFISQVTAQALLTCISEVLGSYGTNWYRQTQKKRSYLSYSVFGVLRQYKASFSFYLHIKFKMPWSDSGGLEW